MRIPPFMVLPVAISLAACHKEKPAPSIDGLTAALQRTAEQALAAPSLANEQITLPARPGQIDTQVAGVIQIASDAGGVAIRSDNPSGAISILATIPENNAEAFKAALRQVKVTMEKPSPTTRLIEVLIEKNASSPTP